jgi:hypothetical protein
MPTAGTTPHFPKPQEPNQEKHAVEGVFSFWRRRTRGLFIIMAALLVAFGGIYAYCKVFSEFRSYDDQGYLMITAEGFMKGQPLYDGLYTQYGPFYYDYEWMVHKLLSLPVTHDVTGILCVFHWLTAAGLLALAGGLTVRSAFAGLFVFMQAAVHLNSLPNEPGHPQELIALLLSVGALVVAKREQRSWAWLVLGGLGAALAFTKINVGAFFVAGILTALFCSAKGLQLHRRLFWGVLVASCLVPLMLMRHQLSAGWAAIFLFQACCALIAAELAAHFFADQSHNGRKPILFVSLGFALTGLVLLTLVLANGTSWSGLVEGLIKGPARLASVYTLPSSFYSLPHRAIPALVSGALSLATGFAVVLGRNHLDRFRLHLGLLKAGYGLLGGLVFAAQMREQFAWLWPWVWLAMVPIGTARSTSNSDNSHRALICLLAAWQGLQAFPVAGTQVYVATFLFVLVYTFCLRDALVILAEQSQVRSWFVTLVGCVGLFGLSWCNPFAAWQYYSQMEPLGIHGATLVRLPHYQAEELRELSAYLRSHGETFFSYPGVNSLYFWTGKQPPTWFNAGDWMVLLSDQQQNEIVMALQRAEHPLVVVNEPGIKYWERGAVAEEKPLVRFIREKCHEIHRIGAYDILEINR